MTTLFKRGGSWVLRYRVGGRHTTRSLGAVSDARAKELYEEHCAGRHVRSTSERNRIVFTRREMYGIYRKSRERAKTRGLEFELAFDDVLAMFNKANGCCQLTGIEFDRSKPEGCTKRPWWPSIDRANSRLGYSARNCRLVCVAVNIAMGEWGFSTLQRMAKALLMGPSAKIITPRLHFS